MNPAMKENLSCEFNILSAEAAGEIEAKRSRFIAALRPCKNEEEARAFIEEIKKKHYDARHNCFAMRFGTPEKVLERFSDDGEPQGTAGKPMLDILKGAELYDLCAVVTRYFGGTLLGTGGLVRAYSDALKDALSNAKAGGLLIPLFKGRIVNVLSDYSYINKVKYQAQMRSLFPFKEVYLEKCELSYVVPEEEACDFEKTVTEMSVGKAEVTAGDSILYGRSSESGTFIY